MFNELDVIMTPTLREKIDKSIIGKLIKAKVLFRIRSSDRKNCKIYN